MIKTTIFTALLATVLASCATLPEDNVQTSSAVDQQIINNEKADDRATRLQ